MKLKAGWLLYAKDIPRDAASRPNIRVALKLIAASLYFFSSYAEKKSNMKVDQVVNAPAKPIAKSALRFSALFIVSPNTNDPKTLTSNIPCGLSVNFRMY